MSTLFNLGDIVSLKDDENYTGVITRMYYIPEDEDGEEFQWINLNDSQFSSQYASYKWKKIGSIENLSERKKPYKCK